MLKRRPEAATELSRYDRHRISRVAWAEVLAGEAPSSRERVAGMIERFEIVEMNEQIARYAADIRHRTRIKLFDAFILATAQVNGGVLVTRDTKAFGFGVTGIRFPYSF